MLKIEFHAHTNHIQDSETNYSPKQLIDEACKKNYDVLCFTEHYYLVDPWLKSYKNDPLKSYHDYKDYAKKKGILLVPGTEIYFPEGEVVLFNFKGDVRKIKKISDLAKLGDDVLKIAAHPYFYRKICLKNNLIKYKHLFDAIEFSHYYTNLFNPNKKAVYLAKKWNMPLVGTGDVHFFPTWNRTFSLVNSKPVPEKIVEAVKNQDFEMFTKPLSTKEFMHESLFVVKNNIKFKLWLKTKFHFRKKLIEKFF